MTEKHESSLPNDVRASLGGHPLEARRVERLWDLLGEADRSEAPVPSTDESWDDIAGRLQVADWQRSWRADDRRLRDRRPSGRRRGVVAVLVTAVFVLAIAGWWMLRPVAVTTAAAEQQSVRLPDGSVVELNSSSSIRYTRHSLILSTASSRSVEIDGEAYFHVRSSSRPFLVETDDAQIHVLGTEFNVRARPAEGTVVTLSSGRIRLAARANPASTVTLADSGATARVAAGVTHSQNNRAGTLDRVLAWRNHGFAVVDWPLDAVLDEMERRFALEIRPRSGVDLVYPLNLFYFRGAAPDEILRDICIEQACSFRETSRGYALTPRDSVSAGPVAAPPRPSSGD